MLRPLMTFLLVVAVAPALAAQQKPTPAVQQAITATWQFDQARSDTVSGDPLAGATMLRPVSGAGGGAGGGHSGGGGRRGRGGGASVAAATAPPADSAAPQRPAQRPSTPNRDPHLQIVLADVDPGAGIVIAANDSVVAMATAAMLAQSAGQINWKTDGTMHQRAQMDGSIIETQAMWHDATLITIKGVAGIGSLKREFKVSKDGKTLEVKESIDASGRKAEKKLVFTRKQ